MILLPLSQGQFAVIDEADAHLAAHKWTLAKRDTVWYAYRRLPPGSPTSTEYLHHAVAGRPAPGFVVDHRDGDGLNCIRENLRHVTQSVNINNTTGTKAGCGCRGVRRRKSGRFAAYLNRDGRQENLGTFDTMEAARSARIAAEVGHFGVQPRRSY